MVSRASTGAIGAVVARFVHTEEVTGSNPVSPTSFEALARRRRGSAALPSAPKRSLVRTQYRPPVSRRRPGAAVVARLCRLHRRGHWFEPSIAHQMECFAHPFRGFQT